MEKNENKILTKLTRYPKKTAPTRWGRPKRFTEIITTTNSIDVNPQICSRNFRFSFTFVFFRHFRGKDSSVNRQEPRSRTYGQTND